ncbi:unnamed protein product [Paramecium primaurelia]|uniref:Trichohyalin-plectin-homology domain-containing protein n=1 Tax=Paramecium primaurelia TaxID=5886 RepID=A0A8S1LSQ4_PARPR|nr:unnamed protein product [Paramecium primaurelia]
MSQEPRAQTVGAFDNKISSVVPLSQLRRIQQNCFGTQENFGLIQKMELHAKSQERVKRWPNTINALRKKKDQTRFERFKADEEERRKQEEEEALYQAQVKQEILEKANRQIYEANPRVRQFQSKLLITDVIQERDAQVELNKYKKTILEMKEEAHHEEVLENVARLQQIEEIKQEEMRKKKMEQRKILKQQHDEMVNNHIKQIQNDRIEGQLNKAKAEQLIKDEEEAENERKRKRLANIEEVKKGNEEIKEQKQLQKIKEQEDDERIRAYAEKKEKIMEMRKKREELKFKEKQEQRQRLIDAQIAKLESIEHEHQRILNKQIQEAEIKAEEVERIKREKQIQLKKKIDESRKITSEFRARDSEQRVKNDKEFQEYWKQRAEELKKMEDDENEQIRQRRVQLKNFQLSQIEEKQKLREQQILQELDEAEEILRKKECCSRTFTSWAQRAVEEWQSNGKNVYPMLKELTAQQQL